MNDNTATKPKLPKTLLEAVRYFSDQDVCVEYVARLRWAGAPVCPRCGGSEHSYLVTRRVWKCRACKYQFSVKVGTIFEQSPIGLDKWLPAVWLLANSKNGVSSHELARSIGISQKSAWHVLHRIRHAMRTGTFERFDGDVEADEAYIGGRVTNRRKTDHRPHDKAMVVGTLQRGTDGLPSQVRAEVLPSHVSPRAHVRGAVEQGATLYTDSARFYKPLETEYKHRTVDHSRGEYARGRVTTNSIENFWTLLKRGLHGTYVQVDPAHLARYVDERVFTYNEREDTDLGRFETVLKRSIGRRVTWDQLTNA